MQEPLGYDARIIMAPKRARHLHFPRHLLLAALLSLAATGCIYRMPIQQGNYLQPSDVAQLATGMTRSQVKFLLGTPMVPTGFDSRRWDYYYYLKMNRRAKPLERRVTVYFENDTVARIERDTPDGVLPPPVPNPVTQPPSFPPAPPTV